MCLKLFFLCLCTDNRGLADFSHELLSFPGLRNIPAKCSTLKAGLTTHPAEGFLGGQGWHMLFKGEAS